MDAISLNIFAAMRQNGQVQRAFVPQLSTGTMPQAQASSVSAVADPDLPVGATQAVPFVDGGYQHNIAPPGSPGRQDQSKHALFTTNPPWAIIPVCQSGKIAPKAKALGLSNQSGFSLNTFKTPNVRPHPFTIADV
jgi:hypothetical protein